MTNPNTTTNDAPAPAPSGSRVREAGREKLIADLLASIRSCWTEDKAPIFTQVEMWLDNLAGLAREPAGGGADAALKMATDTLRFISQASPTTPVILRARDTLDRIAALIATYDKGVSERKLSVSIPAAEAIIEIVRVALSSPASSALASDASPRGEAVAELNAVESAMLEIAQSEGPRGFVLLSPDQARDLIINAQAFCEARGIKVAAHPAPATVELLREALTRARADLMELVEGEQFLAPAIERIDAALAPATEGRKG